MCALWLVASCHQNLINPQQLQKGKVKVDMRCSKGGSILSENKFRICDFRRSSHFEQWNRKSSQHRLFRRSFSFLDFFHSLYFQRTKKKQDPTKN